MKIQTHDEKGYPLNYDPSTFYQEDEYFFHLPTRVLNVVPYESYMISTWGRLYDIQTGNYHPRKLMPEVNDYARVFLRLADGTTIQDYPLHRAVALTFYPIENPENYMVNHIDGVRWHNEPYNLEWVTASGNVRHAIDTGLMVAARGEDNGQSKLTNEQYHTVCKLTQDGYSVPEVLKIMNLSSDFNNIIYNIRNGRSVPHISSQYDFSNMSGPVRMFTDEEARYICEMLQSKPDMLRKEMIRVLGYDVDNMDPNKLRNYTEAIRCIKIRKTYKDISKDYIF